MATVADLCDVRCVPNLIERDVPRLGHVLMDDSHGPYPAQLLWEDRRLRLTMPWFGDAEGNLERRFVGTGGAWGDNSSQSQSEYAIPDDMLFVDQHGPVALIGCRSIGWATNPAYQTGRGTVSIDFAIVDANDTSHFASVHGLQTELEGLGTWLRISSLDAAIESDEEGRVTAATFRLESPEPVRGSRRLNLEFQPSFRWTGGEEPDQTVLQDRARLQTLVTKPRSWDEHLEPHFAVRDLLRVAYWRPVNLRDVRATNDAAPERTLDGTAHGRAWRTVTTVKLGLSRAPISLRNHDLLFSHADTSPGGVNNWLLAHRRAARATQPLLRLLDLDQASAETHVAQLGMGLEALAYQLALDAGMSRRAATNEPFHARVERILRAVPHAAGILGADTLPSNLSAAYNAVKHANRPLPDAPEMLHPYRRGIQLFRTWVMHVVGVPSRRAQALLEGDRVTRAMTQT